jgi:hypothetical protein
VLDGDVGMMLRFLGDLGEIVHEINRIHEFLELDGPGDGFFFEVPLGAFFQCGGEIVIFKKFGHIFNRGNVRLKIAASDSQLASTFPPVLENHLAGRCAAA